MGGTCGQDLGAGYNSIGWGVVQAVGRGFGAQVHPRLLAPVFCRMGTCSGTSTYRTCSRKCPRRRRNPCEQLGFEAFLCLLPLHWFLLSCPPLPSAYRLGFGPLPADTLSTIGLASPCPRSCMGWLGPPSPNLLVTLGVAQETQIPLEFLPGVGATFQVTRLLSQGARVHLSGGWLLPSVRCARGLPAPLSHATWKHLLPLQPVLPLWPFVGCPHLGMARLSVPDPGPEARHGECWLHSARLQWFLGSGLRAG